MLNDGKQSCFGRRKSEAEPPEQRWRYEDIVGISYLGSMVRPHMDPQERAAQFSPFSALTGYEEAVQETVTPEPAPVCADELPEEPFDDVDGLGEKPEPKEIIYYRDRLPYARLFADLNEAHLRVARQLGLSEVPKTREDFSRKGLVKIVDNDYLVVDDLQYSIPYLTEGAAEELQRIAKAFSDSLESKGLLDYKLVVSSLLRTEEDVERLAEACLHAEDFLDAFFA